MSLLIYLLRPFSHEGKEYIGAIVGKLIAFKTFNTVSHALPRNYAIAMFMQYFICTGKKSHNKRNSYLVQAFLTIIYEKVSHKMTLIFLYEIPVTTVLSLIMWPKQSR